MKTLLLVVSAIVLAYFLSPQWRSFERMGDRRFRALSLSRNEILVGVFWPFTVNQDGMRDGVQLALEEINSKHLAGSRSMRLVFRDDDFDWEREKRTAVEFANTPEMSAVIGYYDDPAAIKASAIYESSRLLHLIVGANNTAMTGRGFQYIVRTIVSSDQIARALASMSVDRGRHKVALVFEEDAYGEDLAYQYHVALDSFSVELVYQWSYSRERADFREPVNELKGIDTDMIFFAGLEPWAGDFLREARAVGLKTEIVGAFSDTPEMRARAGSRGLDGALYFEEYDAGSRSQENQEFVHKFRSRFQRDPDTWAAQGYDAMRILANAIRITGSANPLDLSYAIRFMDPWEGANGRYKFDHRGQLEDKPIYLKKYVNGNAVTVQESTPAPAPAVR